MARDFLTIVLVLSVPFGLIGGGAWALATHEAPPDTDDDPYLDYLIPDGVQPKQPQQPEPAEPIEQPARNICARTHADIFAVVQPEIHAIEACVKLQKQIASVPDRLALEFVVDPDGTTREIQTSPTHPDWTLLRMCLDRVFVRMSFGAADTDPCPVSIPIQVSPSEAPPVAPTDEPAPEPAPAPEPEPEPAFRAKLGVKDIIAGARAGSPAVEQCLARANVAPGTYTLTANWTIRPNGTVKSAKLTGPKKVKTAQLSRCVTAAIKRWTFPASNKPTPVKSYPLGPFVSE